MAARSWSLDGVKTFWMRQSSYYRKIRWMQWASRVMFARLLTVKNG